MVLAGSIGVKSSCYEYSMPTHCQIDLRLGCVGANFGRFEWRLPNNARSTM